MNPKIVADGDDTDEASDAPRRRPPAGTEVAVGSSAGDRSPLEVVDVVVVAPSVMLVWAAAMAAPNPRDAKCAGMEEE